MTGKKPAKGNSSSKGKQADSLGKATLYMGLSKSIFHTCPVCSSKTGKGIIYDYLDELYCSKNCIRLQLLLK